MIIDELKCCADDAEADGKSHGFLDRNTAREAIALIESLQKDRERLDWLDTEDIILNRLFADRDSVKRYVHIYRNGQHYGNGDTALLTLRQAIDAAIAQKEGR